MAGTLVGNRQPRNVPAPRPVGAPSLYKPEHCDIAIAMGKDGKSIAQLASTLNVSRQSLYKWADGQPEFADALARMREHAQAWWEAHAQKNLKTKHYQAQLWRYSVQGRFKEDYGEQAQATTVVVDLRAALGHGEEPKIVEGTATLEPPKS